MSDETQMTQDQSNKKKVIRLSLFLALVVVMIGVVIFFSSRLEAEPNYRGGRVVGQAVPDVTLRAMDGETIKLRELTGKKVFINFFNSWCVPCQEEEPALLEFARQRSNDDDFVFIGIVRDDSEENIRTWARNRDLPFTITFDDSEAAAIAFGTTGQPETYAIDGSGRVVASLLSRASVDSLNQMWTSLP